MNKEEFIIQNMTEGKLYGDISKKHNIPRKQLSEWWDSSVELRRLIKKSNQLFASRIDKEEFAEFKKLGRRSFFEWYRKQP